MGAVLVDTTVLIDLLRGRPGAVGGVRALRVAGETIHVCAVNIEEIARGLRPTEHSAAQTLVAGLRIAPLGELEGWQAGHWRREYAARGQTLSQADCLVAAAALSIGARLATGNPKDFPFRELAVETWPVGA